MDDTLLVQNNLINFFPKPWNAIIDQQQLDLICSRISPPFLPKADHVFRALQIHPDQVKVVIVGQDPYPNPQHAMGLAFSVNSEVKPLPASLKNIFQELENDLGYKRVSGDLSDWQEQGVLLINRILTVQQSSPNSHKHIGWEFITDRIIAYVATKNAVGVLWGNQAKPLAKFFNSRNLIIAPHPSPLSAYRGFFGSKPFSKVNSILRSRGEVEIKW